MFSRLLCQSVCSCPAEIPRSVQTFIKCGVDHLKINLSGEYIAGLPAEMSPFAEEEVAMLAQEAKRHGKRVAAHARSSESVKQCVRHGLARSEERRVGTEDYSTCNSRWSPSHSKKNT